MSIVQPSFLKAPAATSAAVLTGLLACLLIDQGVAAADAPAGLSAAQIVDKHVAARGGLAAWHALQTLSVTGKLDAGRGDSLAHSRTLALQGVGASVKRAERAQAQAAADPKKSPEGQVQLPFRLEMQRPHKSRLEVDFAGKTAVQVYDGEKGWKVRPFLNRDDVEPFTADEAATEAAKPDLDGPLVDYAAKGTQVALEATEPVDGHRSYKLKLTMKNGEVRHIWIDAQSFLDVKVEGSPQRVDGKVRSVSIYQRDFRSVQGLMMPYVYETAVDGNSQRHRMTVESVKVNPPLDAARFVKPQVLVAATPPAATAPTPLPAGKP